jgi:hypothetical protein
VLVVDASVVVDWVAPGADPGLPAVVLLAQLAADEIELVALRPKAAQPVGDHKAAIPFLALVFGLARQAWPTSAKSAPWEMLIRPPKVEALEVTVVESVAGLLRKPAFPARGASPAPSSSGVVEGLH